MGVVTTGTGVDFDGIRNLTLPPLEFLFSLSTAIQCSNDPSPVSIQPYDHIEDVALLKSALESHIGQTSLVLMKTSLTLITAATDLPSLWIKSSSLSSQPVVKVTGIKQLSYTTYEKEKSPGPPLDRNNRAKELAMQQSAIAMAMASSVAVTTTPATVLDPTAEALRKTIKMAEMAKKVAILQERQRKNKEEVK